MARISSRLVLASGSTARARLLQAAGLEFAIEPAAIDENAIKNAARANGVAAPACAASLALAKARCIADRDGEALVIGADQLLVAGDEWFDKPMDIATAREQLLALRGRTHSLITAACAVCAGNILWQELSIARLTMRRFSGAFLSDYIAAEGAELLTSVGGYRLEGRGVQLFSKIEGDYFAILGLPLLELIGFLRESGGVPA